MHRQRQLNEHTAYLRVILEFAYLGHQLGFTSVRSEFKATISDTDLVARPKLQLDVELALGEVPHNDVAQHRCTGLSRR